jgi:molecular chaperone DnaK
MSEIAIGIDLGTSNSCVAVLQGDDVEVLPNAYGEPITASVVALREDGSITVGNAAKANIIHDPKHTIYSSKRLMGRYFFSAEVKKAQAICSYEIAEGPNHGVRLKVRDEFFSLPEIGAMVLRELKCIAESRLGQPVTKAVITVPANFNDNQRQATKDAGRIAGLEVLRILNEPTAAALSYGFGKGLTQQVAIYDLGGGTFDISVLEIGSDVFEVLSTCGDTFLGGDDFDDRVIDLLAEEFLEKEGINLRNDPFALEKLKVAAESAKKSLSLENSVDIRIPDIVAGQDGSSLSVERTLTEDEFFKLTQDLIQRTFKVCDEALQQAGLIARDLDGVILVGGPTRLPIIRDAVKTYFQQEPKADVDPDQVVAMGAAIHAATLVDSGREAFLLDVTPLSLRIGVAGGLAEEVIERNTPVPIEQTRTFTTFQDDQESVVIRVYQGEEREAEGNELLGQFEFSGFKKAPRGSMNIDVTFEINADGIVSVTARDRDTGQEASTEITLASGLSEGEMREIIEHNRTDRLETDLPEGSEKLGQVDLVARPVERVPQAAEALDLSSPEPLDEFPLDTEPLEEFPLETEPMDELPLESEPMDEVPLESEPLAANPHTTQPDLEALPEAKPLGMERDLEVLPDTQPIGIEPDLEIVPEAESLEIGTASVAEAEATEAAGAAEALENFEVDLVDDEELDLLPDEELDLLPDEELELDGLGDDDSVTAVSLKKEPEAAGDEPLFDAVGTDLSAPDHDEGKA